MDIAHEQTAVDIALDQTATSLPGLEVTALAVGSHPLRGAVPPMPATVGRFAIRKKLGAGGMGVVYAAYDAELDRQVAVKLVRADLGSERPEATRAAMLREAQAMAKVEHPNVITVFDVGTVGDEVFVAMELVGGGDLRAWMTAQKRDWREILKTCVQAGEGLSAAHRAGLVHRDFKPDNVLVGDDGRVRVTDFGLARQDRSAGSPLVNDLRLTHTGALVGTPAYMAPEQHDGKPVDARADQFAFCVTVWEALFGERPFEGSTYAVLALNVTDGNVRAAPKSDVPARVKRALLRGLSVDPAARFDSMDALLSALAIDRHKRRFVAAIAIPTVIALGAIAFAWTRGPADGATCPLASDKLAGVWDSAQRTAVTRALTAAGPFGAKVAEQTAGSLDAYAKQWSDSWASGCAAKSRGELSHGMFEVRVSCLTERLSALQTIAAGLATADGSVALGAHELVEGLPDISTCNDPAAWVQNAPPPDKRQRMNEIETALQETRVTSARGNPRAAKEEVSRLLGEARTLGYKPLEAAALYRRSELETEMGEHAEAEKTLTEAAQLALANKEDDAAARAYVDLVNLVGYDLGRPAEARRMVPVAEGVIARAHEAPLMRFELATSLARIALMEGKHDEVLGKLDEATQLLAKLPEADRALYGVELLSIRANTLLELGKFADARKVIDEELAARERVEGPAHPFYGNALALRATTELATNEWDAAIADLRHGRDIVSAALGPDSTELMQFEGNLGVISGMLGDWPEALRAARVTAKLAALAGGAEHPDTLKARMNVGSALREVGELDAADKELTEVDALREKVLGADHGDVAVGLGELAELRMRQKRYTDAIALFQRQQAILAKTADADQSASTFATSGIGRAHLAMGNARKAVPLLQSALDALIANEIDPVLRSNTRFSLARATWQIGDRKKARTLARDAVADLDALPPGNNPALHSTLAAWRKAH